MLKYAGTLMKIQIPYHMTSTTSTTLNMYFDFYIHVLATVFYIYMENYVQCICMISILAYVKKILNEVKEGKQG